jgi:nicotinamide-nucleotide amidase
MTMRAEVISIGDEMTSGQRLDTNSQWLSRQLGDLGIRVLYHTTVGDEIDANVEVFRRATERADVVISTGGLGPTADDLTREALATMANVSLYLDEPSLASIQELFALRKRPMPERNRVQALFPEGMRPIPNPHGTAPGIEGHLKCPPGREVHLYALPGVPAEMREMWQGSVQPSLEGIQGARQVIRHRCIKCFGVGESDLEQMLPDMIRRGRLPTVGITVSLATISLRISCHGPSDEACREMMEPTLGIIRETLGDLVFGEEEDELEHVVLRSLADQGKSLAVVESGTSGLLSHWLNAAPPHIGKAYRGSIVLGPGQTPPWSSSGVDPVRGGKHSIGGLRLGGSRAGDVSGGLRARSGPLARGTSGPRGDACPFRRGDPRADHPSLRHHGGTSRYPAGSRREAGPESAATHAARPSRVAALSQSRQAERRDVTN